MPSTSVTSYAVAILRIIEGLWDSCNDRANRAHQQYPEQLHSSMMKRCLKGSPQWSWMRPQELTYSSQGGAENTRLYQSLLLPLTQQTKQVWKPSSLCLSHGWDSTHLRGLLNNIHGEW